MVPKLKFGDRLRHAWNAFKNRDYTDQYPFTASSSHRPDRRTLTTGNAESIIAPILNQIAMDIAAISIRHIRLGQNGRYESTIKSGLNRALTLEANIDQTSRDLLQDIVLSMFDDGVVAVVPVDTDIDITNTNSFDVLSLRTGAIREWYPDAIKVYLYNDKEGEHEEIILPKRSVAIVENPLYAVMNEPNSTLKRLVEKLNLLDAVETSGIGKLDLIVQLPFVIKSEMRKKQADDRKAALEEQLTGSTLGVAYIDAAEKITQLNRPVENNLLEQIIYLTRMLYNQLGLTQSILDGTASEEAMLNYYNRTVEPILGAITLEFKRKFLTRTAIAQNQSIGFFRDMFKLIPAEHLAEIADKFSRNEIMSSNDFRAVIGLEPSKDPRADQLLNKNMAAPESETDKKTKEDKKDAKEETEV